MKIVRSRSTRLVVGISLGLLLWAFGPNLSALAGFSGNVGGCSGNVSGGSGNVSGGSGNVGDGSGNTGGQSGNVGGRSGNVGDCSGNVGGCSGNVGGRSGNVGDCSGNVGGCSGNVGSCSGDHTITLRAPYALTPAEDSYVGKIVWISGRVDRRAASVRVIARSYTARYPGRVRVSNARFGFQLREPQGGPLEIVLRAEAPGASSSSSTLLLRFDVQGPVVTIDPHTTGLVPVTFSGTAHDESTVQSVYVWIESPGGFFLPLVSAQGDAICVDCGESDAVTWEYRATLAPGVYTANVVAVDAVWNQSEVSRQFTIPN